MIVSTALLAMGALFLVTVRLSGNASAYGLAVLVAVVLVAIGCGLHLSALVGTLSLRRSFRLGMAAMGWLLLAIGSAWVVERAPGPELVAWLMIVPVVTGVLGLSAARRDRWAALGFMAVALGLSAFLLPVWLERQGVVG